MNKEFDERRCRVGRNRLARRVRDDSTTEWFEVGRKPDNEWLVQGRAGGSGLLSTDGKLPDQALIIGRRPADMSPGREHLPVGGSQYKEV
jgi:hypothetical protein